MVIVDLFHLVAVCNSCSSGGRGSSSSYILFSSSL